MKESHLRAGDVIDGSDVGTDIGDVRTDSGDVRTGESDVRTGEIDVRSSSNLIGRPTGQSAAVPRQ